MYNELAEGGGALVGKPAVPNDQPLDVTEFENGEVSSQ